jgi:hypothetical protein
MQLPTLEFEVWYIIVLGFPMIFCATIFVIRVGHGRTPIFIIRVANRYILVSIIPCVRFIIFIISYVPLSSVLVVVNAGLDCGSQITLIQSFVVIAHASNENFIISSIWQNILNLMTDANTCKASIHITISEAVLTLSVFKKVLNYVGRLTY